MEEYILDTHYRGDTFPGVQFEYLINGAPANLTGATIRMDVREAWNKPRKLRLSTEVGVGGITILDAPNGIYRIDEQIIDIPPFDSYVYDIEVTFATGRRKTPVKGTWKIEPDVTNG